MGTLSVFANKHAPWYSQGRMLDAWIGRVRAWLSRRSVRIALIAAALGFYGYWVTARVDRARTGDFYVYYVAASAFAANLDAYAMTRSEFAAHAERLQVPSHAYPYYYPTLPALLVWPLTALPPKAAALVWSSMSAATMVGGALLLGLSSAHAFGITLALGLLLGCTAVLDTLNLGQVNAFLFAPLCGALFLLARGRLPGVGAALAVGALFKVVPLAHLAWLGWQRRSTAVGAAVGVVFVASLTSVPLVGTNLVPHGGKVVARLGTLHPANQALSGMVFRALEASAMAPLVWGTLAGTVLLLTVLSCSTRATDGQRARLEFALVTAAITLLMPYTYAHQFVVVLIPSFVLLERALVEPSRRWTLALLLPLFAAASASNVHGLKLHMLKDAYFWWCLACWGLLVVELHLDRRKPQLPSEIPMALRSSK